MGSAFFTRGVPFSTVRQDESYGAFSGLISRVIEPPLTPTICGTAVKMGKKGFGRLATKGQTVILTSLFAASTVFIGWFYVLTGGGFMASVKELRHAAKG